MLGPAWFRERLAAEHAELVASYAHTAAPVRLGALPAPKAPPRVVEASLNRLAPAELHADLALVVGEPAELASLSALAHGDEAGGLPVLLAMYLGHARLPAELATVYHDVVLGRLSAPRRRELEDAMPFFRGREFEYTSEFARKHYGEALLAFSAPADLEASLAAHGG